ncbi:MAG TPA: SpoIVB peptidase S55, partial [Edaphobacter sp.]
QLSGKIGIAGQNPVKLQGILAQSELNPATINAALYVTDLFSKIYGNPLEQPTITGLTLKAERIPERRTAVIESAQLNQTEVRPGQTVEVEVALHPYQADPQLIRIPIKLPENLSPGTVRLLVSDGAVIDKLLQPSAGTSQRAVGLADTIEQLNRLHANNRVHITLLDHAAQALLENEVLPDVPLSMVNVLGPLKDAQRMQLTGESAIGVGSADTQYAVSGSRVLSLTVR